MGLIGAAFGLGFTIGPFIGGVSNPAENGMYLFGLYLKHIHTYYPALPLEYCH